MVKIYDLNERTLHFSKAVIEYCNRLDETIANRVIISQLVRSSTSIGANYREANDTYTKKDLRYKLSIALRESKETEYWLELIHLLYPQTDITFCKEEIQEIRKILASIMHKTQ